MTPLGRKTLCLLIAFSLAGCTLSRPLARHAVSYNITVENAQNRMLLLNVVRASQRRPMYFTGIGSIAAAPSYTLASGEISLTEAIKRSLTNKVVGDTVESTTGTDDTNTDGFTFPSGSYSNKPTMTIGVLDTQDFISGILSPVRIETVRHYLSQGWRPDILAYLLVERIEIYDDHPLVRDWIICQDSGITRILEEDPLSKKKRKKLIIENDPGEPEFKRFRELIAELDDAHCDLQNRNTVTKIQLDKDPSLGDVVKASEVGIHLKDPEKGIIANIIKKSETWALLCSGDFDAYIGELALGEARRAEERMQENLKESSNYSPQDVEIALVLRSPHSALYYLGEILREIQRDDVSSPAEERIPLVNGNPLFWANEGNSSCPTSELSVDYLGKSFYVGGSIDSETPCENRSMQAVALVSQLIALHKSAKNLPETPLVRLVGN